MARGWGGRPDPLVPVFTVSKNINSSGKAVAGLRWRHLTMAYVSAMGTWPETSPLVEATGDCKTLWIRLCQDYKHGKTQLSRSGKAHNQAPAI
jgi:hypothetical protein